MGAENFRKNVSTFVLYRPVSSVILVCNKYFMIES